MEQEDSGKDSEISIEIPVNKWAGQFPSVSEVSGQNGILDRVPDDHHALHEEAYFRSHLLGGKDPEVRIYISGFFDVTFPTSMNMFFDPTGKTDQEIGDAYAKFFNENCILHPVTTEDGIFLSAEELEELDEIYRVDHGYHHPCDPRFRDDCDYAITASGVILLDKISDLDVAIDLLNKECDRNYIDFDLSEDFSFSDIGVMMDNGWNDNNSHGFRYEIPLNLLTKLTKTTMIGSWRPILDTSKLEILRNHIEERKGNFDTRFQHPSMNLVELDFYSVVATPSKTTFGFPLVLTRRAPSFPFPLIATPNYVEQHRFVDLENGKIPDDLYHGPQNTESGYASNPIWNLRHQMLLEAAENSTNHFFDNIKKIRDRRNSEESD